MGDPPHAVTLLELDRTLLDGFRRGERAALAKVLALYLDDVALTVRAGVVVHVDGQAVRVGKDLPEHDVEALVHETFTRAFAEKSRLAYDGVRPYGAYLATIARNLLIDRGRLQRRDALVDVDVGGLASPLHDPAHAAENAELLRCVDDFARDLGEPDRTVFRLRLADEATVRDTGEATGLSDMQVRRRDAKLRQGLLDFLRGRGFLPHAPAAIRSTLVPRREGE